MPTGISKYSRKNKLSDAHNLLTLRICSVYKRTREKDYSIYIPISNSETIRVQNETRAEWKGIKIQCSQTYCNSVLQSYSLESIRGTYYMLHQTLGPCHMLSSTPILFQCLSNVSYTLSFLHLPSPVSLHLL